MAQTQRISRNNTAILNRNGIREVILHGTIIVTVSDNEIILNNGGYVSSTTATRMNQVANEWNLGYGVSRKDGEMFVTYKGVKLPFDGNSITLKI